LTRDDDDDDDDAYNDDKCDKSESNQIKQLYLPK
jgi:hypothetical protein